MVPKLSCVIVIASLECYSEMLYFTVYESKYASKKPKTLRIPNSIETFEPMYIL